MWYRKSLAMLSIVTIMWVEIKWALLKTESTTIITILNPVDFGSSVTKSTLTIFYLAFGTSSKYSSLRNE